MDNRFFKVNEISRFITAITVGQGSTRGCEYVAQTAETAHVVIGWSYVDSQFVDTRSTYDPRRNP
ncbi:hypothetical protein ABIA16_003565 [Sinorhizobium fredii]